MRSALCGFKGWQLGVHFPKGPSQNGAGDQVEAVTLDPAGANMCCMLIPRNVCLPNCTNDGVRSAPAAALTAGPDTLVHACVDLIRGWKEGRQQMPAHGPRFRGPSARRVQEGCAALLLLRLSLPRPSPPIRRGSDRPQLSPLPCPHASPHRLRGRLLREIRPASTP